MVLLFCAADLESGISLLFDSRLIDTCMEFNRIQSFTMLHALGRHNACQRDCRVHKTQSTHTYLRITFVQSLLQAE